MMVCDVWWLNKYTRCYAEEWGWENPEQQQRASLSVTLTNLQTNPIPNKPWNTHIHTHTHKKMNLLRSLFPWQHRLVLMMFLPSRQAGFGRITAQIGALLPVTKGAFREGEREAQMVGRIATLKKTPTHMHNWVLQYWFEWMEEKKT